MIVELKNIFKTYEQGKMDVPVLKNISMSIKEGDYVAIMGPSGSGKTTLMNIIGCLDNPTRGSYVLDGENVLTDNDSKLSDIRLKSIGFVFQSFHLLPRQSALENVALPLLYAGVKKAERLEVAKTALERVGLADRIDFKPTQLSGGQCQRVAIARAIVNKPKILLADEPTGALDTTSGEQIMELFKSLNNEGVTVIMITHEHEIAMHANTVYYIRDGRFVNDAGRKQLPVRNNGLGTAINQQTNQNPIPSAEAVKADRPKTVSPVNSIEPGVPQTAKPKSVTVPVVNEPISGQDYSKWSAVPEKKENSEKSDFKVPLNEITEEKINELSDIKAAPENNKDVIHKTEKTDIGVQITNKASDNQIPLSDNADKTIDTEEAAQIVEDTKTAVEPEASEEKTSSAESFETSPVADQTQKQEEIQQENPEEAVQEKEIVKTDENEKSPEKDPVFSDILNSISKSPEELDSIPYVPNPDNMEELENTLRSDMQAVISKVANDIGLDRRKYPVSDTGSNISDGNSPLSDEKGESENEE